MALLRIMMMLALLNPAICASASGEFTDVSGQIVDASGKALSGGSVFFSDTRSVPPAQEEYWRVPDILKPLDAEGRFSVRVPTGTYYIGALKRTGNRRIGPPQSGDLFCVGTDGNGQKRRFAINGEKADAGIACRAVPFTARKNVAKTAIEGIVVDPQGKAVPGVVVFASLASGPAAKPLFASDPTADDGRFIVGLDGGGAFYLKTRPASSAGAPSTGEIMGMYGEKGRQLPVQVKGGEHVTGICIHAEPLQRTGSEKTGPMRDLPKRKQP